MYTTTYPLVVIMDASLLGIDHSRQSKQSNLLKPSPISESVETVAGLGETSRDGTSLVGTSQTGGLRTSRDGMGLVAGLALDNSGVGGRSGVMTNDKRKEKCKDLE